MPTAAKINTSGSDTETTTTTLNGAWSIRPCEVYKDEYSDCTSFKARFHQYFINGESSDCTQWQRDFENCERYQESNGNNTEAGQAIIDSEEQRRTQRMRAHYGNTTWQRRKQPPADWAAPLPEWFVKRNENTFLELKQAEMEGRAPVEAEAKSYCAIM